MVNHAVGRVNEQEDDTGMNKGHPRCAFTGATVSFASRQCLFAKNLLLECADLDDRMMNGCGGYTRVASPHAPHGMPQDL
jgi:hypothetical protein